MSKRKKRLRLGDTRIVEKKEKDGTLYYMAERVEWQRAADYSYRDWTPVYDTKSGSIADTERKLAALLQAEANMDYRRVVR